MCTVAWNTITCPRSQGENRGNTGATSRLRWIPSTEKRRTMIDRFQTHFFERCSASKTWNRSKSPWKRIGVNARIVSPLRLSLASREAISCKLKWNWIKRFAPVSVGRANKERVNLSMPLLDYIATERIYSVESGRRSNLRFDAIVGETTYTAARKFSTATIYATES